MNKFTHLVKFVDKENTMNFANWLQQELDKRGWNHTELARRSEVSPGQISRVVNGSRGAGPDLCIAIAKGLDLPREEVFRARGWLLYDSEYLDFKLKPETALIAREIDQLPPTLRRVVLKSTNATVNALREEIE